MLLFPFCKYSGVGLSKKQPCGDFYILKKKKSVLIGHVFGVSAENVNISSVSAWIAFILVLIFPFWPGVSFCEVCSVVLRAISSLE